MNAETVCFCICGRPLYYNAKKLKYECLKCKAKYKKENVPEKYKQLMLNLTDTE